MFASRLKTYPNFRQSYKTSVVTLRYPGKTLCINVAGSGGQSTGQINHC